jgi:hypothetical protein
LVDNVAITAGSGTAIAADDIGSVFYQRVKVNWGPDGTANEADTATGKPLPVQLRSATGLIPLGEPTDAKNAATDTTSVAVIPLLKQLSAYLGTLAGTVASGEFETVAASQTAQTIGATGAAGDYLAGVMCFPQTTTPGVVTILDNASQWGSFPGGASSVSNLVPFFIPVGCSSVSGAWKVTTGANIHCVAMGNFT